MGLYSPMDLPTPIQGIFQLAYSPVCVDKGFGDLSTLQLSFLGMPVP